MENDYEIIDNQYFNKEIDKEALSSYLSKVYNWMAFALFTTGIVAYLTANSEFMLNLIFSSKWVFYGLLFGELALVGYLISVIHKLSTSTAMAIFMGYAALNGLTLSTVFLVYTSGSIATTFYITGGTFGIMSLYGYYTKRDLTSMGNMLMMALVGLIIASIFNFFFQNEMLYWITTYVGVLVFVGLIAYDTQKVKQIGMQGFADGREEGNSAIMGALALYLDFINLFILLLRLFGRRK